MHAVRTYTSWLLIPRTKGVCYLIKKHYCHFCLKIPNGNVPTVFKLYLCRWLRVLNSRYYCPSSGFKTSRQPPEFHRLLDCMSPATLVIAVCSWQTISVLFLSLRQHSNFTLNFAAIIHTQTNFRSFLSKKKPSNRPLCPEPYAFVFCR